MDSFALRQANRQSPMSRRPSGFGDPESQPLISGGDKAGSFASVSSAGGSFHSTPIHPVASPAPVPLHAPAKTDNGPGADGTQHRRLNSTQIFDLYRRLDVDANGQLDLVEFLRVAKILHIHEGAEGADCDAGTDHLAKIFRAADASNNGFLTATEFSRAYDMILAHKGKPHRQSVQSYVEAVRYGRLGEQYFVSIYTGTVDSITTFQSVIPRREPMEYKGTLAGLVDMIAEDAARNGSDSARQNIMWWVDVSCSERSVSLTRELCAVFGLSEEAEALFLTSNLAGVEKSRMVTGLGTRQGAMVHSMGIAIETMWLEHRPVVDMYPPYADSCWYAGPLRWLHEYITPRLSALYSYKRSRDEERSNALTTAESKARALSPKFYAPMPTGWEGRERKHKVDFLLCDRDIRQRGAPKFVSDVAIFQLLKYGASRANCLLSFRQVDDYGEGGGPRPRLPEGDGRAQAHRGILGRLLTGMRAKVVEVMDARGVSYEGQLADSSAQLLAAAVHLVHDYCVSSTLSPLQLWMDTLEQELLFAAMTKHDRHIRDIRRLLGDVNGYVKPFSHVLESHILAPPAGPPSKTQRVRSRDSPPPPPAAPRDRAGSVGSEQDDRPSAGAGGIAGGMAGKGVASGDRPAQSSPMVRAPSMGRDPLGRAANAAVFKGTRRRAESEIDGRPPPLLQHSQSDVTEEELVAREARAGAAEGLRLQLMSPGMAAKMSPFHARAHEMMRHGSLLREVHDIARESFADLLYGNTILRKKGCVDWLKRLQQYEVHLDELASMHAKQLEEQRTSYMFVLTIFQVMSWPITFMTGYWGMNFDNMPEISEGSYPLPFFPGYKLMWFTAACVYTIIIAFVLHTKLLHGAF